MFPSLESIWLFPVRDELSCTEVKFRRAIPLRKKSATKMDELWERCLIGGNLRMMKKAGLSAIMVWWITMIMPLAPALMSTSTHISDDPACQGRNSYIGNTSICRWRSLLFVGQPQTICSTSRPCQLVSSSCGGMTWSQSARSSSCPPIFS